MSRSTYHKPTTLEEARENPRYKGKILVSAGGEVHGTYQDQRAAELYRKLKRKYPDDPPVTTVIPKGSIVMWHQPTINKSLS